MDNIWAPWRYSYISMVDEGDDGCVFCKEDEFFIARTQLCSIRLNKFPYNNGHLLIMPNRHISDISELSQEEQLELLRIIILAKDVLKEALSPEGFNIGLNLGRVAGAGIDRHLHFHIVPRWNGDTNFMPILADTKVISQSLYELRDILKKRFSEKGLSTE